MTNLSGGEDGLRCSFACTTPIVLPAQTFTAREQRTFPRAALETGSSALAGTQAALYRAHHPPDDAPETCENRPAGGLPVTKLAAAGSLAYRNDHPS